MLDLGIRQDQLTVLLIDDDLISREVTATVLTMSGYTVHTADNGAASLEILNGGEVAPDVILMDAQMPGLSGAGLIGELRARSRARILAVSGSSVKTELTAAADGFLLKPLDVEALRKLLEGHPAGTSSARSFVTDADAPVVSLEVLAQLRQLMPEAAVRQIYQAIVADLDRRAKTLETAFAKGDWAEIRRIGHAVKGGCAMAGALQAARLGAMLEAAGLGSAGNQSDNSARLLNDLRSAAQALQGMLDGELPASP
ncbi:MAG: response regulator [Terracidiphilus sp.]